MTPPTAVPSSRLPKLRHSHPPNEAAAVRLRRQGAIIHPDAQGFDIAAYRLFHESLIEMCRSFARAWRKSELYNSSAASANSIRRAAASAVLLPRSAPYGTAAQHVHGLHLFCALLSWCHLDFYIDIVAPCLPAEFSAYLRVADSDQSRVMAKAREYG